MVRYKRRESVGRGKNDHWGTKKDYWGNGVKIYRRGEGGTRIRKKINKDGMWRYTRGAEVGEGFKMLLY